ncbi:EF-hand calcium-binding domain-containing protein 12 isoform X2 [Sceloporus undulatus]|nr:EF-hand calcium-binding domain-containing protein 12 isoform X2 [Sceloporus undulatus]
MHNVDLHRKSSLDDPDKILGHCFKQFKLREAYPHFFFKVKKSRFGPPRCRRRIIIAPPMRGSVPSSPKPPSDIPCDLKEKAPVLEIPPQAKDEEEEDELQQLEAWIEERKKLQDLLNNCVNLEEWLTAKQPVSNLEASVLGKIKEGKEPKEVKMEPALEAVKSIEHLMPKRDKGRSIPRLNIPYPDSLRTLQSLLHKQKLKLVDLFNKADRTKSMKFKRADFIKIIQSTKVPISKNDLEDIVIYLSSLKKGNYITSDDLAECQKIWMDSLRDQWKQTKETKQGTKQSSVTVSKAASIAHSKAKLLSSQINYLEVPPINTETDRMHLTYNQMEMIGKRYREMRRKLKRKIDPLDFAEQCRMVRTGDIAVDGHCMPSTMEGEMGELVDKHRLVCHLVWTQCVKLCEKYKVPLTEKLLKRALLYPGDRLLREGNSFRKIRQPGGYYSTAPHPQTPSSDEESGKTAVQKGKPKAEKEELKAEKTVKCRWMSFTEFRKLMRYRSKRLLPPMDLWKNRTIYENLFETPETLEEQYVERQLWKMFSFLNPLTDANSFWPGHLLDKLRLYSPQMEHDNGNALFSRVSRTRPVYPGMYTPDRSWKVSDQGYLTYGDPDSRKHYYYI